MKSKMRKFKKKSCDNKHPYPSRGAAMGAIKGMNKRNFIFHKMDAYHCKFCGKWHIGRTKTILYDKFRQLTNLSV